jgi:hypothetical protein
MRRADLFIADADPVNGTDAVFTLTVTATGGAFKFKYKYRKSSAVAVSGMNAASIQTALRTISGFETSTVTGTGPFTVTALGAVGKAAVQGQLSISDNTATGGTVALTVATPGVDATMRGLRTPSVVIGPTGISWVSTGTPSAPAWVKVGTQT